MPSYTTNAHALALDNRKPPELSSVAEVDRESKKMF
jgi:hypothetical protein